MNSERETLTDALRRMPVPPLREGFIGAAIAQATAESQPRAPRRLGVLARWETWLGAGLGAAAAVVGTILLLGSDVPVAPVAGVTLAVNESRNVEVLIDSERTLDGATIRVATTGVVELAGHDGRHELEWRTRVERGRNVLSLPVVARAEGNAQLVAVIEHQGRKREIALNLVVKASRGRIA